MHPPTKSNPRQYAYTLGFLSPQERKKEREREREKEREKERERKREREREREKERSRSTNLFAPGPSHLHDLSPPAFFTYQPSYFNLASKEMPSFRR
jgi:hypothetical protein